MVRGGAARGGSCDVPRDRAWLFRPAAGRRPALVSAPAPEPVRRRGSRQRPRLAVRRRLQRRADARPAQRARADLHRAGALAASGSRPGGHTPVEGVPAALRPARRRRRALSRSSGSASGSSPTTTTTWPSSRSGTAGAATRISASSRASPAPTRSCAARTSRASSASSRSRRPSAQPSATPWPRRRGPTRCGC